jgi:hypothetical protein
VVRVETIRMTMRIEVKQAATKTVCSMDPCLSCSSVTSFTSAQSQTKKAGGKDETSPSERYPSCLASPFNTPLSENTTVTLLRVQ